jgi:hypothetical protein
MTQGPKRCGSESSRFQLSLGPTVWVEFSLGINVVGINVKAPEMSGESATAMLNANLISIKK